MPLELVAIDDTINNVFVLDPQKGGKVEKFYKRVPKKQKFLILSEHFNDGLSVSELSRKHQIQPATIYKWREKMKKEEDKPSFYKDFPWFSNQKILCGLNLFYNRYYHYLA